MVGTDKTNADVNKMAGSLAKVVYNVQLHALDDTLDRFHTPKTRYSILEENDDALCLTYENGEWITFSSERGCQTSVLSFNNVEDACKKIMYYMAESPEEYDQMVYYFENLINESNKERFTSKELFNALKKGLAQISGSAAAL